MAHNRALSEIFVDVMANPADGSHKRHIDIARRQTNSGDRTDRLRANGVLLVLGDETSKAEARQRLIAFAQDENQLTVPEKMDLLTIIMQLRSKLDICGKLTGFIMAMAASSEPEFRCNAIIVLAEIAKTDRAAIERLRALCNDSNESVRNNANVFLRKLSAES